MNSLQHLTLATVISILGLNATKVARVDAEVIADKSAFSTQNNASFTVAKGDRFFLAQKSSDKKSPETEDEMIKELQKRDKKIEAFKDMLKIDGIVPEVDIDEEDSVKTGDEMMDALQNRQQKIQKLKELKQTQDLLNNQKIDDLQKQGIDVADVAELNKISEIVNNKNLDDEAILKALQDSGVNVDSLAQLQIIGKIVNAGKPASTASSESGQLSATMAFRMFAIGIPGVILLFLIGKPIVKGIIDTVKGNYQKKFGKPSIPERSLNLHNNALKEVKTIGKKANKIDDDKFGNEEFKALINFKVDVAKNIEGYKDLNYKVELLRAAIIAQKSFLKLESTELCYRSRRQQQFYKYVADNLEEDLDKEEFAKKIKKKQAEILPLINTEQGREAIHAYARDINDLSKHELGLKLLALFKKYDLKDFSIIREISEVVEGLQGADLLEPKRLVLTVKEYYDLFEKIAPILGISQEESSPANYARILQIVGLMYRHGDSYQQFRELIRLLHKWEQPYETVTMIREQFSSREYNLPPEFKTEIPGVNTHEKYAEYLEDLS